MTLEQEIKKVMVGHEKDALLNKRSEEHTSELSHSEISRMPSSA